jgi:hypothetical protein
VCDAGQIIPSNKEALEDGRKEQNAEKWNTDLGMIHSCVMPVYATSIRGSFSRLSNCKV